MAEKSVEIARARNMVQSGEARELRVRHGLSLADIAADIGVDPSTVYYWEAGRSLPRGRHARVYARLLDRLRKERER